MGIDALGGDAVLGHGLCQRAVFLDRDGVLVRAFVRDGRPYPPAGLDDLEILPGVADALTRLHEAGFLLIVVTNQPDVARGKQAKMMVEAQHVALRASLFLNDVRVCYHTDADGCTCRKPSSGLLLAAAQEYRIDLASSYMVGDRWRDVEAGLRAGCTTIFVNHDYLEALPRRPHVQVYSMGEAADWILDRIHVLSQQNSR